MKERPVRKRIRLKGYDYSSTGAYFVTICVKDKHELLGEVVVGCDALGAPLMQLSKYGALIHKEIEDIHLYYENVRVDHFVVMPNHVHMIVAIYEYNGAPRASRPTTALIPNVIGILKRKTNRAYGFNMWQKSFHDHIIRDDAEYHRICRYIDENPAKWTEDEYYAR